MDFVIIHHFDIWKDPIFVVYENHPSSHASFGFAIKILGMLLKEKRKKKRVQTENLRGIHVIFTIKLLNDHR